jgi:hypothetical protein
VKNPQSLAKLMEFTGPDGHFSLMIPGTPQYASDAVPLKNVAESVQMNQFYTELEGNNISYMLIYSDYPPSVGNGAPTVVLQQAKTGALAGKTMISEAIIALGTVPGVAFTCRDTDGWIYDVHMFYQNKRLYQLIIVTAPNYNATFRDAFMNSFTLK